MENYPGIKLKATINIGKLYSVHYFEYPANFKFEGVIKIQKIKQFFNNLTKKGPTN